LGGAGVRANAQKSRPYDLGGLVYPYSYLSTNPTENLLSFVRRRIIIRLIRILVVCSKFILILLFITKKAARD